MLFKQLMRSCILVLISSTVYAQSPNKNDNEHLTQLITVDAIWLQQSYQNYQAGSPLLTQVVKYLTIAADHALTQSPVSVLDKTLVPPSGDKRDYISVGPYWWPDSTKPDGLPWIKKDGKVNPMSKTNGSDKPVMNEMLFQISSLALAYHYTKEAKYAQHAALLVDTWFLNDKTGMYPSLKFGQAVPGVSDGRSYGIIETRWFMRLIDDVTLISDSKFFDKQAQTKFKHWIKSYSNWLETSDLGKEQCQAHNNHGTYCEAQIAYYAFYTGDNEKAKYYVNKVFKERLAKQVEPNGAQTDELSRTRPLHYSLFNLEAYFYAARVADHLGLDMWNFKAENGASIKQMIDFMLPAIEDKGYWQKVKDKKMRKARLFYFIEYAYQKYREDKYLDGISQIFSLAPEEDRSEFAQCLLIMPTSSALTLEQLQEIDATGKKSSYRCYY